MTKSNTWIICFNATGSDSIAYVDGRKSIEDVHAHAMKHYNKMKKFKGIFFTSIWYWQRCKAFPSKYKTIHHY